MEKLADMVLLVIGVLGSVAAFTTIMRLMAPPAPEDTSALAGLTPKQGGELSVFDSLNPSGGFIERLDYLLARNLGLDKRLEELYMLMGKPEQTTPLKMLHRKELVAALVPAFLGYMMATPWVVVLAPVAFMLPDFYYKGRIAERQRNIVRHFPSTVDLAALTIESGLDYMSAFDRIIRTVTKKSDLELEIERTLSEVQLGYSRREALRRLAMRTGVQEVRSFVGLIIQSDELGTSLVDLLRNFSQDMRFRRMNRAEKAAAQASTKMLLPIFFFIFPTVFILMLAPMMMNLFQGGLGF